jgi:CubicO group peptidase (beta-lactamase class C family)
MWTDGEALEARTRAVLAILARPPAQAPGTYVYSNAGYMVLGVVLERHTGTTWETLMHTELFVPLGMRSAGFGPPGDLLEVDQPWGHRVADTDEPTPVAPTVHADNPPSMGPAGTVHCSLPDWGKFLTTQSAGLSGEHTLLTAATIERLRRPLPGGHYAGGWIVTEPAWAAGPVYVHDGSNTMWYTVAWVVPETKTVYAAVSNYGGHTAMEAADNTIGELAQRYDTAGFA